MSDPTSTIARTGSSTGRRRGLARRVALACIAATSALAGADVRFASIQDPPAPHPSPLAPPTARDARALGVGRFVLPVAAPDLEGAARTWVDGRGERATVIALSSATCPLVRRFAPALARAEDRWRDRGVAFVHVHVGGLDDRDAIRAHRRTHGLDGLVLDDRDGAITDALDARTTTEVFVIDASGTLAYRGAISDQYGVRHALDAPRERWLDDALGAVLAGDPVRVAATNAPGCAIEPGTTPDATATEPVTWSRQIARLVQANCLECHRAGGVAPFALDSYDAVSRRARMIAAVIDEGSMPPWFADSSSDDDAPVAHPGVAWANERRVTDAERRDLRAWIAAGKPRGDEADAPLPRRFPDDAWTIGTPDAIVEIPRPVEVPAEGVMPYRHFLVRSGLEEDRWIRAIQILPTERSVVHHVLVFVLDEAVVREHRRELDELIDETAGFFAVYVPGNDSVVYPEGMAKPLPADSVLLFQLHYTPNGVPVTDRTRLGLVFADEAPTHVVRSSAVAERRIRIPAGAPDHREIARVRVPADARLLSFMPHMHVRGRSFRYELETPDGTRSTLLDVPAYDFNWQLRYELRAPVDVPRGAVVHGIARFDNSAGNPANPDPTRVVEWGPQTDDEMLIGYFEYHLLDESDAEAADRVRDGVRRVDPDAGAAARSEFDRLLERFDRNGDGRLARDEVPSNLHAHFDHLDRDDDEVVTRAEFDR